ncbi:hypothetical protein CEXT_640871 [Caerostris extrusa]|uniref:Uncharacterized protein n=1 Tax=Caerostris extrusa TaxID=172846 RepID=A0AAV4MXV8_CAEEX|nr:hypothetical protein CEXT_640871 [Caerostris extrusa]
MHIFTLKKNVVKKNYCHQYAEIPNFYPLLVQLFLLLLSSSGKYSRNCGAPGGFSEAYEIQPHSGQDVFRQITSIAENRFLQLTPFSRGNNNINNPR